MGGGFGVGIKPSGLFASNYVIFQRTVIASAVKVISKQGRKFFDAFCMNCFHDLANLAMKFGALFDQDRFVRRFLNQHMAEGIFILE